jgi:hypothetical protein
MGGFGEKVRTWRGGGFTLELWDTNIPTGTGRLAHTLLAFRLSDRGRVIFAGDGFSPPLGVCIDSDECIASLLFWFTLQQGDTDAGYFADYTALQREWVESGRAEDLAGVVREMRGDR